MDDLYVGSEELDELHEKYELLVGEIGSLQNQFEEYKNRDTEEILSSVNNAEQLCIDMENRMDRLERSFWQLVETLNQVLNLPLDDLPTR